MKIVFAGTPEFAVPCLKALIDSSHEIVAVFTQPDRPAGRGRKLTPSPVKQVAHQYNIDVYQPKSLKSEPQQLQLSALKPDVLVVIAYGLILPEQILITPSFGCINVHASVLPRWRGASPIQQAILHGDSHSGVTIMQMDKGLDTGDILKIERCLISEHETSHTLHDKLATIATEPLLTVIDQLAKGLTTPVKQNDRNACYAPKISKLDSLIDWSDNAKQIDRMIRAYIPWPIATTSIGGKVLRIHHATVASANEKAPPGSVISADKDGIVIACGNEALSLKRIQFANCKAMDVIDILNSRQEWFAKGVMLGQ
jgi:methionyl-tRNA formyltransferase